VHLLDGLREDGCGSFASVDHGPRHVVFTPDADVRGVAAITRSAGRDAAVTAPILFNVTTVTTDALSDIAKFGGIRAVLLLDLLPAMIHGSACRATLALGRRLRLTLDAARRS
jgi:hypothetical protein